jgi:chemotaxis protein MotA
MNLSVPLGFISAVLVLWLASHGVPNLGILLSWHAFVIVIGGTIAAALICFPLSHFYSLAMVFLRTFTGQAKAEMLRTIQEIERISEAIHSGQELSSEVSKIKNPFLRESLELLEQGGLADDELDEVLEKRVELQNERYKRDSATFKTIGKFPPAFGLVGTSLGMIALLQGLGGANAFEQIGPAMSIALVATFYGLVLSNFVLIPVGENLNEASADDLLMRRVVMDGVMLIKERKHPLLVREYLKSYLAPADRNRIAPKKGKPA